MTHRISAEARGRRRQWLHAAKQRRDRLEAAINSTEYRKALDEFCRPTGTRRTRAKLTMDRLLAGLCWPELEYYRGRYPLRVFRTIEPSAMALAQAQDCDSEDEDILADMTDGASVCYLLQGRIDRTMQMQSSAWTLIASVHALGRLLDRFPQADVDEVLHMAHRSVLLTRDIAAMATGSMFVPTPGGGFLCDTRAWPTTWSTGKAFVPLGRTWISSDMVGADQVARYEAMTQGHDAPWWLLPEPLRVIEHDGTGWTCRLTDYAANAIGSERP